MRQWEPENGDVASLQIATNVTLFDETDLRQLRAQLTAPAQSIPEDQVPHPLRSRLLGETDEYRVESIATMDFNALMVLSSQMLYSG